GVVLLQPLAQAVDVDPGRRVVDAGFGLAEDGFRNLPLRGGRAGLTPRGQKIEQFEQAAALAERAAAAHAFHLGSKNVVRPLAGHSNALPDDRNRRSGVAVTRCNAGITVNNLVWRAA